MLKVEGINKRLGQFQLKGISFEVNKGDYFMLLGPSGSGKSLILEIIAGFVKQDHGSIHINGVDISFSNVSKRRVGLVFQDLAIFPNMNVAQNIGYPIRRKGISGSEERARVLDISDKLAISHLLDRSVSKLSGGELQRVALARTLALEPEILLLDEPLSSIDVQLKAEIKSLLRGINRNGQTIIHVTHDYDEAISLGNKVVVINDGTVVQQGTPLEVFQNPRSEFVANFSGIKNFFFGSLCDQTDHDLKCFLISNRRFWLYSEDVSSDGFVYFPENVVTISSEEPMNSSMNKHRGVITDVFQQRFGYEVWVDIGIRIAALVTWESVVALGLKTGSDVWISIKANAVKFIPKI